MRYLETLSNMFRSTSLSQCTKFVPWPADLYVSSRQLTCIHFIFSWFWMIGRDMAWWRVKQRNRRVIVKGDVYSGAYKCRNCEMTLYMRFSEIIFCPVVVLNIILYVAVILFCASLYALYFVHCKRCTVAVIIFKVKLFDSVLEFLVYSQFPLNQHKALFTSY